MPDNPRLCFIADARSPIARNWISYFPPRGYAVDVLTTEAPSEANVIPGATVHYVGLGPGAANGKRHFSRPSISSLKRFVDPYTLWGRGLFRMHDNLMMPAKCVLLTRRTRKLIQKLHPDIVHALRIPIEGELGAMAGIHPFVASVWGNDFTLHAAKSVFHRALTRQTIRMADGLLADCYADLRNACEFGLRKDVPTLRIPGCGGLTKHLFSPGTANRAVLTSLGIDPDRPVVLNARGFRKYVRNDAFFAAIPKVLAARPDIQFVGVGLLGWNRAERWIEQFGVSSSVVLTGHLSQAELAEVYRSATVVVSPAEHDGTPNTLLEAMASECLPICGDLPSIREWITNDVNGILIDPADPEMMATAILAGVSNKSLQERAARLNVQLVAQLANYDECMRGAELFYREVIARFRGATDSSGETISHPREESCPPQMIGPEGIHEFPPSTTTVRAAVAVCGTLEPAEYFSLTAGTWGKKYLEGGKMAPRVEVCLKPLREVLAAASKVLDFGCGSGQITLALNSAGYLTTGLDASPGMIAQSRRTCEGTSIDFIQVAPSRWSAIPVEGGAFDAIVASSVMEYVPEPAAQIREFARVLRDDGLIVMTVPNPSHPRRVIERPLRAMARTSLVRMLLPLLPEQLAAYFGYLALSINHFPLCAWSSNLRDAGLRIDQVTDLKSPLLTIVARKVNTASE